MRVIKNLNLSECTSFGTGGPSENFVAAESSDDLIEIIKTQPRPFWLLGVGANSLISDKGLPGTTIHVMLKNMAFDDTHVVVDAGVYWDTLVIASIEKGLWGLEHMSGIPSSVGGAVVGNIAAYGQAVSDTLEWVEVIEHDSDYPEVIRIPANELDFGYRSSIFSKGNYSNAVILRACFKLSTSPVTELQYESALKIAEEENLDVATLEGRRQTILKAREKAGSLWDNKHTQKTAGSFFKNPVVDSDLAEKIMAYEERAITRDQILNQNKIHGGQTTRVSAAHVLLAAGFERGQSWGPVRLHPDHILKLENTGAATSQQIYNVAMEIVSRVKEKLGIDLEPEVRFLGDFSN